LLLTVMNGMAADGLRHALVQNDASNQASRNLYRSCGFKPWQAEDGFLKMIH